MNQRSPETVGQIRARARSNAEEILDQYWDGNLPVDPVALARMAGTSVFTAQLGDDVFGMIIGSGDSADIYLDQDQGMPRMRFTCAHELGHYVDHSMRGDTLVSSKGYVDKRSEEGRGTAPEIYANEFAASLLMPERNVQQDVKRGKSIAQMANTFQVSLSAMSWRLKHLGLEARA